MLWSFQIYFYIAYQPLLSFPSSYQNLDKPKTPTRTHYPLLGNLLKLGDQPHKSLTNLAKIHGPIEHEWAMAETLHNREILKKAKMELEQTIGKGKILEESDIASLPYLQAIVKETLRKHPPVPLIPRKVNAKVEIKDYIVPNRAQVLVNVWAIGPGLWEGPEVFRPERFLGSEIDFRGTNFELIPFGAGRRICQGLALAVWVVPVVVGSLLNSFDWKMDGGIAPEALDMDEKFGITLQRANPLRVIPFHFSE